MEQKKLKDTIFLPKTSFPMRGDLAKKEPYILEEWENNNLFQQLRKNSKGKEKFILHFGPPYANGHIHIGHALIGILKDAVNKSYQMLGFDAPLVLGFDCHGLPIEWKIEEEYIKEGKERSEISIVEFMGRCREFATKWSLIQQTEFQKLGIIADFENCYSTMHPKSEAIICQKFFEILKKGFVYRGKRPVMWSVVEQTALAEAELEYQDKVSDAIFVKFAISQSSRKEFEGAFVVIWTTTPWTIPANMAIAYASKFHYVLISANNEKYILAKDLLSSFAQEAEIGAFEIILEFDGNELEKIICEHPLKNLSFTHDIPMLPSEHVTKDVGTGLVHIAPAHGVEDFMLAQKFGLNIFNVVTDDGKMVDSLPFFQGEHVFKVNSLIIEQLKNSNRLIKAYKINHSYPHSWRSKAPLIFRTTSQWFISIDDIRPILLQEIDKTEWFPNGYVNRIKSMVEKRPDWCVSRQRLWGVPIALFVHRETNNILQDQEVFDRIVQAFAEEGIESWHTKSDQFFLGEKYSAEDYIKVQDTLEVWFESGCSHHYVLEEREEMSWPADLYFEGSDQHRGWFQSSLVESCCISGKAPYKQVATNGFVLDKDGKKMSKSIGNVISPDEVVKTRGADVLRLWCVNSDYSEDLRIGDEILNRQQDVYRRFRNTLRFLLGVLDDFHPDDVVEYADLPELEKIILHSLFRLDILLKKSIKTYDFKQFFTALHTFCANELSAFYFDIRKDAIYCDKKSGQKRMGCLYVMNEIFVCISHWLAPVLSFTAEEAWLNYPFNIEKTSIHLCQFPAVPLLWNNTKLNEKWNIVKEVRKTITEAIEIERAAKTIGSSLEAEIICYSSDIELIEILSQIDLSEIAIVSKHIFINGQIASGAFVNKNINFGVCVSHVAGNKCDRCWKFASDVANVETQYGRYDLCPRCLEVIS